MIAAFVIAVRSSCLYCAYYTKGAHIVCYVMATAKRREPRDLRRSCTVPGAPGGESPPSNATVVGGRVRMIRSAGLVAVVGFLLSGCGADNPRLLQSRADVLNAQYVSASRACDDTHPAGNPKTALVRAKCQVEAAAIRRPLVRYPDLLDTYIAKRLSVAEQVQAGKITVAKGSDIIANEISKLVAEEKRRNRSNQSSSDDGTESIVYASPHSCTNIVNSGECF
jgi:hypothetical protein